MGKYDEAIVDYNKALAIKQDDDKALNNRGWAYCLNGDYARGLEDANKSFRIRPNDAETLDTRVTAYQGYDAFLSLDMHGKPKTWLLTGWKRNVPGTVGEPLSNPKATQNGLTFSRADLGAGTFQLSP
ncbi:MAG: tetratricopeptide repeat protein [Treponematales bacterium]